ncbi:kinase-like domain-containing protein [Elsinoe ampelina]|uniref:Kinase-like domain-containing protein n=1 Tax=Elsinoe ampelina TaxID=302913 RepID=A0A6A6G726_9PEZI|nr:kinase-like domain-containing protein [Elsinoe ampelina]
MATKAQKIEPICEFTGISDITSCLFLLRPLKEPAIEALNEPVNARSVETATKCNPAGHGTVTGHVVRVQTRATEKWAWTVGSGPLDDLQLTGLRSRHLTFSALGFADDDTKEEVTTVLELLDNEGAVLADKLDADQPETGFEVIGGRRGLIRPRTIFFAGYEYEFCYPKLSTEERKVQRELLRSVMNIDPVRDIPYHDLEKLEYIDSGSYGKVYKRMDYTTGRVFALKKISLAKIAKQGKGYRAAREIQTLKSIQHINVIRSLPYLDSFSDVETSILMSYFEFTLDSAMGAGKISKLHIPDIMFQVLAGLKYIHWEIMQVHRDLKPNNVLLRIKDNGSIIAKIADLGLATALVRGIADSSGGGNTYYKAPEVFDRSVHRISAAADMFSYAVMFSNVWNPKRWERRRREASDRDQIDGTWGCTIQSVIGDQDLGGLQCWLHRCLEFDPASRPTALELGVAVDAFESERTIPDVDKMIMNRLVVDVSELEDPEELENLLVEKVVMRILGRRKKQRRHQEQRDLPAGGRKRVLLKNEAHQEDQRRRKRRKVSFSDMDTDSRPGPIHYKRRRDRYRDPPLQDQNSEHPHGNSKATAAKSSSGLHRDAFDFELEGTRAAPPVNYSAGMDWSPYASARDALKTSIRSISEFLSSLGGKTSPRPRLEERRLASGNMTPPHIKTEPPELQSDSVR